MAMLIDKGESLIHKLSFQPWYSQGVVEHFFFGGGGGPKDNIFSVF